MNVFFNQTTQDNRQIFKECPLRQANKPTNTTFEMEMSKKKKIN